MTKLLRSIAVRLARAMGGGIDYWLGLPIDELFANMVELIEQLEAEEEKG